MPRKTLPKQRIRVCRYCGRSFSNASAAVETGKKQVQYQVYCSRECYDWSRTARPLVKKGLPQQGLRLIRTEDGSLVEVRLNAQGLLTIVTLPEVSKVRWCIHRMMEVYGRVVDREEKNPPRIVLPASTHGNAGKKGHPVTVIPVDRCSVIPVEVQATSTIIPT